MWDKLLSKDLQSFMVKASGESEDSQTTSQFFKIIQKRVKDYKVLVVLATQWKSYEDIKQANVAIKYAGMFHASRFILMMDYLVDKFEKGELK